MTEFRPCVVIPTHNHVDAMEATLAQLEEQQLPVIVVDDGSAPEIGLRIRKICTRHSNAEYLRHAFNGGKGFAVMCGIAAAVEHGYTHVVQIDADGQHDLASVEPMLNAARLAPDAIVTGLPQYDRSMPLARSIWRPLTTFWVHVNTLSFHIKDAMCGFRVYPAAPILELVRKSVHSRHMEFDVEVLVKARWAGFSMVPVPVRVTYPEENFSNFDMLRDNVRLSLMQARLFFGMLVRAPSWLFRRSRRSAEAGRPLASWAAMRERGAYWGMRTLAGIYWLLGRRACLVAMSPAVLYFFITGKEQREASREYLMHMWRRGHLSKRPTLWLSFRHFLSFSSSALDKLAAWTGKITLSDLNGEGVQALRDLTLSGRGAIVITSHVGNPEVVRAIAMLGKRAPINVLMHTAHAEMFNRMIAVFSPGAPVRAIPVTTVGADTAMLLSQAVERGEWVILTGDRVPVTESGRTVDVPFLGEPAPFPQGPYVLGSILKVPAYLLFCVRGRKGFDVHFSKFADRIVLPRQDRLEAIRGYAEAFSEALEAAVAKEPLQWFNFYPFWRTAPKPHIEMPLARKVV